MAGGRPAPPAALDVDMIDGTKGWALSTSCNGESTQPCAYFVSVTVNAGRTWSNRVQVGPRIGSTNGDAPRHIHFIDAQHGFVWGGFEAYSTYNGGRTWSPATLRASEYVAFTGRGLPTIDDPQCYGNNSTPENPRQREGAQGATEADHGGDHGNTHATCFRATLFGCCGGAVCRGDVGCPNPSRCPGLGPRGGCR